MIDITEQQAYYSSKISSIKSEIEAINKKIEKADSIRPKIKEIIQKNSDFCDKLSVVAKYLKSVQINGESYDKGEFSERAKKLSEYENSFNTLINAINEKIEELNERIRKLRRERNRFENLLDNCQANNK